MSVRNPNRRYACASVSRIPGISSNSTETRRRRAALEAAFRRSTDGLPSAAAKSPDTSVARRSSALARSPIASPREAGIVFSKEHVAPAAICARRHFRCRATRVPGRLLRKSSETHISLIYWPSWRLVAHRIRRVYGVRKISRSLRKSAASLPRSPPTTSDAHNFQDASATVSMIKRHIRCSPDVCAVQRSRGTVHSLDRSSARRSRNSHGSLVPVQDDGLFT